MLYRLYVSTTDGGSVEFEWSFVHMIDDYLRLHLGVYQNELALWMAKFRVTDMYAKTMWCYVVNMYTGWYMVIC